MCRPHGPTCTATCGYRASRLRQRHQRHRLAVQVGPRCGHDTWGTSFYDGFPPCAGPRVSKTGSPPHRTPRAHRPGGRPLRPLAHLRSLPPEPMHAPASSPNAASSHEVRQQPGHTARPLPLTASPARRVIFSQRVELAQRGINDGFNEWRTT